MHWVVVGASGFLGQALTTTVTQQGDTVQGLSLRDPATADLSVLDEADVVVNLAGASIGRVPWTSSYRQLLRNSRIVSTRAIAERIASRARPPVFVLQTATGVYGADRGDTVLDEDSEPGDGFLAELVVDWEAAAMPAIESGCRVVRLRTGVVLDRDGGAFGPMLLPFRFGLGGRLGSGRQYMCVVGLFDWIAAVRFVVANQDCSGPYNVVLPTPPTNQQFTEALGRALRRPTLLPVPAWAIRTVLGGLAVELLGSRRAVPRRLREAGFEFGAPTVDAMLTDALHQV